MSRLAWQARPIIETSREDKLRSPTFCTLLSFVEGFDYFVLRRILCGGFRKCFGLVGGGPPEYRQRRQALLSITDGKFLYFSVKLFGFINNFLWISRNFFGDFMTLFLDWWVVGRRSTDRGRQALLSITDGLCSGGQSQKAGTCHVLRGHSYIHFHVEFTFYISLYIMVTGQSHKRQGQNQFSFVLRVHIYQMNSG